MKLRNPHLWIALCSAVLVLSIALVDVGSTSPGPLSAVHERESDLSGSRSCSECHGGWRTSMTEACLECHQVISEQMEEGAGLHGALDETKAPLCALCHSEHHGSSFTIVNAQSFAQSGFPSRDDFDHQMIGFPMDGAHLELSCDECHENAFEAMVPRGGVRYLGLDQSCYTCHEDPHEGYFVVSCASCHGQTEWDQLASMGHEEFLPLVGGHAEMDCTECHESGTGRSLERLGTRPNGPLRPRQCVDCHESPHQTEFVEGVAQQVPMSVEASCVVCHEAEHTSFLDEGLTMTPEQHAASGFPLEVPHDGLSCADCHSTELDSFAARYPGRGAEECSACHEDIHEGQFDDGPFGIENDQECSACHDPEWFDPHAFTIELHDLAALPLTGSHVETDCNECHQIPEENAPRLFRGISSDCESCHKDAHQRFFDEVEREHDWIEHGMCARCHETDTFSEYTDAFDHGVWTRLEIQGAHAQTECETCHPRSETPDQFGRTFGWADEHFGRYRGCITCHQDPHEGEFDGPGLPRKLEGRRGCERCHDQVSFRSMPNGFDHGLWTGFMLRGAHAEVACSRCHPPLREPDDLGRTWERAAGIQCGSCHMDPHAGQFEKNGETTCRRCHTRATSFTDLSFNHDWDSRFKLGEAHEKLPCSACHLPVDINGVEVIRYRPMGRECIDCHGDNDGPLRSRRGRRKR